MAKKNPKNVERRAMVEQMRREQARKERMRSMLIFGVCVVIVAGLLGVAVWQYVADSRENSKLANTEVSKLGVSEAAASCDDIETKPTDKNQSHIPDGTPITYTDAPPAFGAHRPQPAAFGRPFYTADDRPEVAQLVHNEEHGYTIIWYDDTAAKDKDELKNIKAIATKYQDDKQRVIAAPWTTADGKAFPDGKHIALTRWTADAKDPGDEAKQAGNWQYCGKASGAVISDFVKKWPHAQSPEPNVGM